MSCPHAETTTLAWLYGEGDDAHALHVAGCPACQAVAELHEGVQAQVAPVLPRGSEAPVAPARRGRWWVAAAVALAAGVLLALVPGGAVSEPAPVPTPVAEAVPSSMWSGDLELELADLDASLDVLAADLSSL